MTGWIKLHRKLRDSAIYNEGLVFLLIECLFSATHKDIKIDYAGTETTLKAGQFVFGRHQWAKRLKINESTLYKRITKLTKYGILTVQNSNSFSGTIYQIEKWNEYQREEQPSNSQVTAKEQLGNTNKNEKNEKNEKNIYSSNEKIIFNYFENKNLDNPKIVELATKYDIRPKDVVYCLEDMLSKSSEKNVEIKNVEAKINKWINNSIRWHYVKTLSAKETEDKEKPKPKLSDEDKWIIQMKKAGRFIN